MDKISSLCIIKNGPYLYHASDSGDRVVVHAARCKVCRHAGKRRNEVSQADRVDLQSLYFFAAVSKPN